MRAGASAAYRRSGLCARLALLLLALLLLPACMRAPPAIPVAAQLAGQRLQTTVDAPIARYYVERYLAGAREQPQWDAALDAIHRALGQQLPTPQQLRAWSQQHSVDLAALLLARQLDRQAQRQPFHALYIEELSAALNAQQQGRPVLLARDSDFLFLFVPGWLYKTNPATGADFARFRALLGRHGARVALVDIGENLSVEANARLIEAQIRTHAAAGRPLVLVSSSKGGPEVALALSALQGDPALAHVKAWLNIGGLLRGTPLADLGLRWPVSWYLQSASLPDGSLDGIRSLATATSAQRFANLKAVPQLLVINLIGIPLSGQVTELARDGYLYLRDAGPNDGLTYPLDALMPGGVTIPMLGADHYFRSDDIDLRALALAGAIARYVRQGHVLHGKSGRIDFPSDREAMPLQQGVAADEVKNGAFMFLPIIIKFDESRKPATVTPIR